MSTKYQIYSSPIGDLILCEEDGRLTMVEFADPDTEYKSHPDLQGQNTAPELTPLLAETVRQLDQYFAGKRRDFDLPLAPQGTPFQQLVWAALRQIPYGTTASYGQIAEAIGNPKASRAVGMANNRNPIAVIIPCHRVIGADGSLVGYGGGLPIKKQLLELEGAL